jgi:hypothetical protein
MPRSVAAYLVDILEACDAIDSVFEDVDLAAYQSRRTIFSSVEREFILIGEAVASLRAPTWRASTSGGSVRASSCGTRSSDRRWPPGGGTQG